MIKLNLKPTTKNKEFESFLTQSQDITFIHKGVLTPSYVNIGSNIGSGTAIDTYTVGVQIGKNVHVSGGVESAVF